jgi:hypothetical protein
MSLSFWIRDYVFLPLAMIRREVWWRNLALVVSMVLFGLWHRASVLFLVWGCYHGVLLVLHRQVQQAGRTFDWDPPAFWTPPFVDCDHGAHQPGLDFLSREFSAAGASDAPWRWYRQRATFRTFRAEASMCW